MITICGTAEVKYKMVNLKDNMQNVFTCMKCVSYLSCYVGSGYGKPYKHLYGWFGVDLHTTIDETKERAYATNAWYIATLLSCTSTIEDATHDWVEIIVNKFWPVIWVEDEDIQSVMKYPSSDNLSTKMWRIYCLSWRRWWRKQFRADEW